MPTRINCKIYSRQCTVYIVCYYWHHEIMFVAAEKNLIDILKKCYLTPNSKFSFGAKQPNSIWMFI